MKKKIKTTKKEIGPGIEELLIKLRKGKGLSRIELVEKLKSENLTEQDIKKWEIGLEYPDLDMIYKLSEIYEVPSQEFIQAKNNSFEKGLAGINANFIKWICYLLNVSFYTGVVITIILYAVVLILAFLFFITMAANVRK